MFKLVVGFALLSCAVGDRFSIGGLYGGSETSIDKFPYQVSLQFDTIHYCSGSLYSPTAVITSASCVTDKKPEELSVRFGSDDRYAHGLTVNVASITIHPNYNEETDINDIAMVRLSKPVPESTVFVKLASKAPSAGTSALLSGWELENSFAAFGSDILHSLEVNVIDNSKCDNLGKKLQPAMICAISPTKGSSCQGESGSPLTVNGVLYGVLSWGPECHDRKDHSAVYTSVADFKSWIEQNA